MNFVGFSSTVLGLLSLSGCALLPQSAPTTRQMTAPTATFAGKSIKVVDVEPGLVSEPAKGQPNEWTIGNAQPRLDRISVGDRLSVTIYEIGYGLFGNSAPTNTNDISQPSAPSAGGRALPAMMVPEGGAITLPYLGRFAVVGRTSADVAREIERRLRGKSQSAQVVLSVDRGEGHSVILSGDVKQPGRLLLSPAGERLLDGIALAGGPTARAADTIVRLTRGNQTAEARLESLASGGSNNVILGPGDRIELVRNVRSFTVLGAAKSVAEISFDSDRLTLSEALARAGGPVDERADAKGVFIFRFESENGSEIPVIYRLNLLAPQSYFTAQRFLMREKDVMLIANARSNQLNKFVQMVNQLVTPAVTVDLLTR
jgi:polysaccharide biosynthesis/export protein